MNVDQHAIALCPAYRSRDNDQRVLGDKVADASLLLHVLLARVRGDVELEGLRNAEEEKQAAGKLQE